MNTERVHKDFHPGLLRIFEILAMPDSIKLFVEEIYHILEIISTSLTDKEKEELSSAIKNKIQTEAIESFRIAGSGAILMATGVGKSKIAIDICYKLSLINKDYLPKILLVVPTEKLRDENWKDEFEKWGHLSIWDNMVDRCCYASLNNYAGEHFDLVILDEVHNVTENNLGVFYKGNTVRSYLALTATKPKDPAKIELLKTVGIYPVYSLSLDEAIKLGAVAPYVVTVINMTLDNVHKYIQGGNAKKRFFVTEKANYVYLSSLLLEAPTKAGYIRRMRAIYDLKSKTNIAKLLLEHVIPKDLRTLIFCSSIEQAIEVCPHRFYSKPSLSKKDKDDERKAARVARGISAYNGDKDFIDFKEKRINRLSCINKLNEGENIPDVDVALVIQLDSNELNLLQRLGRILRYRPEHVGQIIILCVEDSVEKDWVKSATKSLNMKINKVELSRLRMGIETITF